jgi:starvation-inducible outer membrane lipoprotein
MSAFRLSPIALIVVTLLAGCAEVPPGLEKEWARREAAQWDLDMCTHVNPRNPSGCSATRAAYDAALKDYRAASSQGR